MKLAKTYSFLKKDLITIENALNEVIQADHPVLRQASTQLLKAGGKRIRPVFVLLSGKFGDFNLEELKTIAVSLELIHTATLVHDDVIDDASLRRGKPTVKHRYGNRAAMYTGDYILARALESIATIEKPAVHQALAEAIVEVCLGEIEQMKDKYNWDQNLRHYLRRIKRKTALLIATSCQVGGISAGLTERQSKKLYKYGYYIGMSYQIIDDILDFTSSSKVLGKPAGNDLKQGNVTLPVLIAKENQAFADCLADAFESPEQIEEEKMTEVIRLINDSHAIEQSYQLSERYLSKALKEIEDLPDIKAKQSLEDIARFIGKRRS